MENDLIESYWLILFSALKKTSVQVFIFREYQQLKLYEKVYLNKTHCIAVHAFYLTRRANFKAYINTGGICACTFVGKLECNLKCYFHLRRFIQDV